MKQLTAKQQIALHKKKSAIVSFFKVLKANNIPLPIIEYQFHPERKWRFDYYWQQNRFALEVEGGVWTGGRHTRGTGFLKDMEKYNTATIMGFRIIRTVPDDLTSDTTIRMIKQLINI